MVENEQSIIPQKFKVAHLCAERTDQGTYAFVVDVAVEIEVKPVLEILPFEGT